MKLPNGIEAGQRIHVAGLFNQDTNTPYPLNGASNFISTLSSISVTGVTASLSFTPSTGGLEKYTIECDDDSSNILPQSSTITIQGNLYYTMIIGFYSASLSGLDLPTVSRLSSISPFLLTALNFSSVSVSWIPVTNVSCINGYRVMVTNGNTSQLCLIHLLTL